MPAPSSETTALTSEEEQVRAQAEIDVDHTHKHKHKHSEGRRSSVHEVGHSTAPLPPTLGKGRERRASEGSRDVPATDDSHNRYTRGTLWVGDIPTKQVKAQGPHSGPITTYFSKWGAVLSVTVKEKTHSKKPNPNWAFVTFVDYGDAAKLLADHEIEPVSMSDGSYQYDLDVQEARVKSELETHAHANVLRQVWTTHKHKDAAAAQIMKIASGAEVLLPNGKYEGDGKTPEQAIGVGKGRGVTVHLPGQHPHKDGGVWVSTVVNHSKELAEYLVWLRTDSEVARLVPTHGELVATIRRAVGVPSPELMAAAAVSVALCIILMFVFLALFIGASADLSALEKTVAEKDAEIDRMVLPGEHPPSCTGVTVSDAESGNTALVGSAFTIELTTANCGGPLSHVVLVDPATGANKFLPCRKTSEDPECASGTTCIHRCTANIGASDLEVGLYEAIPMRYDSEVDVKTICGACSNALNMVGKCGSAVYGSDPYTLDVTVNSCTTGIGSITVTSGGGPQTCRLPSDYNPSGPGKQSTTCTLTTAIENAGYTSVSVTGVDGSDCGTCLGGTCQLNQHVVNHVCHDCPPGSTRDAGDVVAAENTACTPEQCGENQYVKNHACVPCAAGFTRPRDNSDRDRLCSPSHTFRGLCENLHTNIATGVNTQCWPSRCDTNMEDKCPDGYTGADCDGGRFTCRSESGFHGDRCCWGTCSTTGICD
eukprot:COSAG02_NODE_692_length_18432_cov_12.452681_1_plen_711_part_00